MRHRKGLGWLAVKRSALQTVVFPLFVAGVSCTTYPSRPPPPTVTAHGASAPSPFLSTVPPKPVAAASVHDMPVAPAGSEVRAEPPAPSRSRWLAPTASSTTTSSTPSTSPSTSPDSNALPLLPKFFTALLRLSKGERADHVRIVWLGDSHTQPDIWTDAVRRPLQERFGVAGPGFIHVGWKKWGYRHAGVDLSVQGRWRIEPPRLLSVDTYDDGILGLGGVRLIPTAGARAGLSVDPAALPGPARWDLALRVGANAALRILPDGSEPIDVEKRAGPPALRHVVWSTQGPGGSFEVTSLRGRIELLGVVVESNGKPGVVLDVLGLNGARVVHALTWNESAWVDALRRRKPNLVVLAYGTNEAGMRNLSMRRHRQRLVALLDRAHVASPEADCLIVGAMDRGGSKMSEKIERLNQAQAAAAKDRGCAFWSAQKAMGGRDSMQVWASEKPALAASGRIHLTVRGYHRLGAMLARDLLRAFDEGASDEGAPDEGASN